ncbi:1-phosphofructokinase family hexose kinase [Nonomuraea sp. NPDC050310]|uniref:1-phosphofructokinase family hexose kinase n=1 Tax=unclassified Nonomuraea TaxID=2593643 RepID=UPI0033E54EA5
MIVTVTLNAALDVTYQVGEVDWEGVNRVRSVHRRAGGKGVNVARVLVALGQEVIVTGLAGGLTGQAIKADLEASGLPDAFVRVAGESRSTLVVAPSHGGAALFNEPGPEVSAAELACFLDTFDGLAKGAQAVVVSGSLPRGVPTDVYAEIARRAACPVIVDADGEALRQAVPGRPALIKPNAEELARAVPGASPEEAARHLMAEGAGAVVVSMGADGLLAVTPEGAFRARMPYRVEGNPTGAGDALVAGLALGLVGGEPWPERLRRAAALGAAAVATPVAGEIDHEVFSELQPKIVIE